jgi:DNA-binding MarR family transcriptional regulator
MAHGRSRSTTRGVAAQGSGRLVAVRKTGSGPSGRARPSLTRANLGFLLAKASQRWNELLSERFSERGYEHVRPSYGSVLVPLFEEDGLRMTELARRARLAKQTMTTMVRLVERAGLVERRADPEDGRVTRVFLTPRGHRFHPVAAEVVAEIDELVTRQLGERPVKALRDALEDLGAPIGSTSSPANARP